jgi:hypothetical protein
MFKEATSKTATVFEGMQNINMHGGSTGYDTPVEITVPKKETTEEK